MQFVLLENQRVNHQSLRKTSRVNHLIIKKQTLSLDTQKTKDEPSTTVIMFI